MTDHTGELAALATAVCWAGSALGFDAAGRRVGSLPANLLRMPLALLLLAVVMLARGQVPGLGAGARTWLWLSASGLIGFVLGDICLFRAIVEIGPRLSSLIMSLAPVFAAVFGWLVLGERLTAVHWLGMAAVIGGIAWAVGDGAPPGAAGRVLPHRIPTPRGVALALGGAAGQGLGLVTAKLGMGDYDPLASTFIRVLAGLAGLAVVFTLFGQWAPVARAARDRRGMGYIVIGTVFGPFLGVSLALLSVQRTETGIAAALMATTPILLIPLVVWLHRERVGLGGVLGAILTVAGVALLFQ